MTRNTRLYNCTVGCPHYQAAQAGRPELGGVCRQPAPFPFVVGQDQAKRYVVMGIWPSVQAHDWCSHHPMEQAMLAMRAQQSQAGIKSELYAAAQRDPPRAVPDDAEAFARFKAEVLRREAAVCDDDPLPGESIGGPAAAKPS